MGSRGSWDHLKSTYKKVNGVKTGNVDWDAWEKDAAMTTDDILAVYSDVKGGSAKKDEGITVLKGRSHEFKRRINEKNG